MVVWDLKGLAERTYQITTALQLQAFIQEQVGVILTIQTVRSLRRQAPAAPRCEMIQLLCDVFNCRSDAFYVLHPNPERKRQWGKAKLEGKKPSPLYESKSVGDLERSVSATDEIVESEVPGSLKSLQLTFTDPRTLFKDKMRSKE